MTDEIDLILQKFAQAIAGVLGDKFVGFYVYGSYTLDEWNSTTSDIDCMIILKEPLNDIDTTQLTELHQTLIQPDAFGAKLEGEYIPLSDLQTHNFTGRVAAIKEGVFLADYSNQVTADNVHSMIKHGQVITGAPLESLGVQVAEDQYLDTVRELLLEVKRDLNEAKTFKETYDCMVDILRCIYTLQTRETPSKPKSIELANDLLGGHVYDNIMKFQSGDIDEFEIDKQSLLNVCNYGLSLW